MAINLHKNAVSAADNAVTCVRTSQFAVSYIPRAESFQKHPPSPAPLQTAESRGTFSNHPHPSS